MVRRRSRAEGSAPRLRARNDAIGRLDSIPPAARWPRSPWTKYSGRSVAVNPPLQSLFEPGPLGAADGRLGVTPALYVALPPARRPGQGVRRRERGGAPQSLLERGAILGRGGHVGRSSVQPYAGSCNSLDASTRYFARFRRSSQPRTYSDALLACSHGIDT